MAYLKRSGREEPASSGSPRGMPRGVGAGGEISRAAMVSRDCGRPRSAPKEPETVGVASLGTTSAIDGGCPPGGGTGPAVPPGTTDQASPPPGRAPAEKQRPARGKRGRRIPIRGRKAQETPMTTIAAPLMTGCAALLLLAVAPPG